MPDPFVALLCPLLHFDGNLGILAFRVQADGLPVLGRDLFRLAAGEGLRGSRLVCALLEYCLSRLCLLLWNFSVFFRVVTLVLCISYHTHRFFSRPTPLWRHLWRHLLVPTPSPRRRYSGAFFGRSLRTNGTASSRSESLADLEAGAPVDQKQCGRTVSRRCSSLAAFHLARHAP